MPGDDVCVFRHPNVLLVSHVRNVLESAGVDARLRNMTLAGGAGELPLDQCEAEVWVSRVDERSARRWVRVAIEGPAETPPGWRCESCGEWLEGAFDTCWRCGQSRPD